MNVAYDFGGQTVVVTGGAQGIGLELSRFFCDAGAHVFIVDYDQAAASRSAAAIGAIAIGADVSKTDEVDLAVRQIISHTGRLDVLINNAGILRDKMLWKLTDDDWEQVMAIHVGGTSRMTRACVAHFRAQNFGRVINVTSYTGLRGNIGQANYAAAKAGIVGFTKTAAKELARFGVTVNAISPNALTRMVSSIPEDNKAELTAGIPMGRFADPREMSFAVGFLASHEAGYITGTVLPIDGGMSI
ncbi:SDR family oxidoreductase [Mycobacterium deserti]|uniref:3-oxoacyl-[acyl-carrier-protein] reductase MabA n=1 Tax=Mycobacterium deserti TaxID=2978347 RepID=A0ABT2MEM1_9MYCO|nr:SDR family oxidoreductase [Mycobacterium deserti]MCT7660725.1 SDR family oxidoreductase [Mycobacterium deserti]